MKDRPGELERCRPYTPAYCFEQHSVLLHHRRYHCAATMEHCENGRRSVQKDVKPEDEYTISPCTEHP